MEGGPDRRVLVGRVLQLDDAEREPVHEQHHVGTAGVLPLRDSELIDGEPVVIFWRLEVEHARLRAGDETVRSAKLHRGPVHQHAVYSAVALNERRRIRTGELPVGIIQGLWW